MEQQVGMAFAGRPEAFPEERSASGPMDPGSVGLWFVF